ncbi:putative disease resistance protein RGA3 [Glycine max]|nr:putative disease resistance protein RGA3 [Glycine max]
MEGYPSASRKKASDEIDKKKLGKCKKAIDEILKKFGEQSSEIGVLCNNILDQIKEANEIALDILEPLLDSLVMIPSGNAPTKLVTSKVLEKLESVEQDAKYLNKMVVAMGQYSKKDWDIVAYFSLFPQCGELDAERLIDLWKAERFFDSSSIGGPGCLSQLGGISMALDEKKDDFGQVRSCKMHRLMHDIAKSKVSNEENITNPNRDQVLSKVQRASIDLSKIDLSKSRVRDQLYQAKQLKSIFFNKSEQEKPGKILEKIIFKNWKELRVLDLRNLGIEDVPSSIGDLKELEYLDLSGNKMKKLPSSITKLSKLHTLKLFCCSHLKELPKDFKNLGKLKHLDMEQCDVLTGMPCKMGELSSLQKLSTFVGFPGSRLPDWLISLENLVKLSLHQDIQNPHGCKLEYLLEQDNQLPKLKILKLENLVHLEYITQNCFNGENFCKSLEEMTIINCPKLNSWWKPGTEARPSFEKISKLHLHRCPLHTMPLYPRLEEMVLHSCTLKLLRQNTMSIPLTDLHIQDCDDLQNLSGVFQHLSSLQRLTIEICKSIDGESKAWEGLKSLSCLTLKQIEHLSSLSFADRVTTLRQLTLENCRPLPSISIGKLTSLEELTLVNCGELTSIRDCIGQVTSLRSLNISGCEKLESLPEAMKDLKSLETLRISNCKLLKPRCVERSGEDWPKIRHIKRLHEKKNSSALKEN